jgi:3-oxocholest-4-en-26-oate---CoA ligase
VNENVSTVYEAIADADGAALALVQGVRRVTWHELDDRAARLAAFFQSSGLDSGSRIVIALWNSIEYVETMLAACKARMVPVNINYRASPRELRHYFERSDAAAIVFHESLGATVAEAVDALKPPRLLIGVADQSGVARPPGSTDYAEAIAGSRPAARMRRSGDDQLIMFTGGTTGLPKAVLWRHHDLLALLARNAGNATSFDQIAIAAQASRQAAKAPHTFMLPPLMHSTGLFGTMGALAGGGSVVFSTSRSLDPDLVWREIKRERVESLTIVGDVFSRPLTDALRRMEPADAQDTASSLKIVRSVGVRWSPDAKADLLAFGDMVLLDVLASSEGGAVASWETKKINGTITTNYTLMPHAFLIDENGERIALGSGKTGIVVSAGILPDGYIGERADGNTGTFRVMDGRRVVVTGDFARAELDGTLTLIGRGSSVINTGGEKVFADEVEQVIAQHPDVADVIVAGVPDPRWGHLVGAVVALRPGAQTGEAELTLWVGNELAGYKKPRRFRLVPAIERKATGKADRQWAASLLAGGTDPDK